MLVFEQMAQSPTLTVFYCALFGAMVGSFINVVAYRLPLIKKQSRHAQSLSLSFPPSRCPHCHQPIRYWQNIPVLSWFALRGRCAQCQIAIPARYMWVELLTGIFSGLVASLLPFGLTLLLSILLLWWGLALLLTPNGWRFPELLFPFVVLAGSLVILSFFRGCILLQC